MNLVTSRRKAPFAIASHNIMSTSVVSADIPIVRKNGKNWHEPRKAFRPASGQTTYAKRAARQAQEAEIKKVEKEMKEEKEAERQVSIVVSIRRACH